MIHQFQRDRTERCCRAQGLSVRIERFAQTDPYFIAATEKAPDSPSTGVETEAMVRRLRTLFHELAEVGRAVPQQILSVSDGLTDPRQLAYLIAAAASLPRAGRQEILELDPVGAKLRRLIELLEHELSVRRLEQEVTSRTQQRMTKQQREHLLREQLRSIQSELGEDSEGGSETAELRKRVEGTPLSPEARREAERELQRLEQIPPISPEFGIAELPDPAAAAPVGKETGGRFEIAKARAIRRGPLRPSEKIRAILTIPGAEARQERHAPVSLTARGFRACGGAGSRSRASSAPPEGRLAGAVDRAAMGWKFADQLGGVHDEARSARPRRRARGGSGRRSALGGQRRWIRAHARRGGRASGELQGVRRRRCWRCWTRRGTTPSSTPTWRAVDCRRSFICTANTVETISPLLDRWRW